MAIAPNRRLIVRLANSNKRERSNREAIHAATGETLAGVAIRQRMSA
ncbi:hypothetical protein [Mesorhizobium humile]|uniref:Uncharacterized protein n=1 Tax=Mesorhizobium humile TaxID=3072313 RepID=A0ABU4YII6_9HYPH|nr:MULTISPECIES: hypothetical protein [unclassified Mesorhizobium]MDX8462026.1 hypothetical protein [Mesorhizobium sp. VK2D]MDX8485885.1 hypothetical protein [Mesorhizobium sp. VK2B]